MIKWKDLPVEIQERMLKEQVKQGNKRDASVFDREIQSLRYEGGFDWGNEAGGAIFWRNIIINKKLSVFFRKYPKKHHPKFKKGQKYTLKTDSNLTILCTGNNKKHPDRFEGVVISGKPPLLAVGSYYRSFSKLSYRKS